MLTGAAIRIVAPDSGPAELETRELSASADDLARLADFYNGLYVREFPDGDERESLANITRYLELKGQGWYGRNNYHVALFYERGELVGASISDYLAEVTTGVIEFLVVVPERRGAGRGRGVLERTEALLAADAERHGHQLAAIVAEMNDPFKASVRDSLDPFLRLRIWDRWGYAKLDLPYIQPALSSEQQPVAYLLLAMKVFGPAAATWPAPAVLRIVHEYIRWAMRYDNPTRSAEYRAMAIYLEARAQIRLIPLATYAGEDGALVVHEIDSADDPDLPAVVGIYVQTFATGPTTSDPSALRQRLRRDGTRGHDRHLWALRTAPERPVSGVASFFTLPGAGFGGYVAFDKALRGTGRLRAAVARIEARMVRDGRQARGWYIECERGGSSAIPTFRRLGFREAVVDYRQPRLRPSDPDGQLPLALLYKPFGSVYGAPIVSVTEFLSALAEIFRIVYGVDPPTDHPVHRAIAAALSTLNGGVVPFA